MVGSEPVPDIHSKSKGLLVEDGWAMASRGCWGLEGEWRDRSKMRGCGWGFLQSGGIGMGNARSSPSTAAFLSRT